MLTLISVTSGRRFHHTALHTLQICAVFNCVHFPLQSRCTVYIFYHIQSNVEIKKKKTVNLVYNYFIVIGAAIKCNPYSETTVECRTQLKTVKITLNIFAVYLKFRAEAHLD